MISSASRLSFASFFVILGACAYTDSVPIIGGSERGFAYPVCYPFLVVSGGNANLLMVPNPNKQRAAQFGAFLAKNNLDVTFGNCGPAQLKADMDSTTVPVELFKTLTEAAKQGSLFGAEEKEKPAAGQSIQVFEFVFDKNGTFAELKPLIRPQDMVRIPPVASGIPPAKKSPGSGSNPKLEDPLKKGGKS